MSEVPSGRGKKMNRESSSSEASAQSGKRPDRERRRRDSNRGGRGGGGGGGGANRDRRRKAPKEPPPTTTTPPPTKANMVPGGGTKKQHNCGESESNRRADRSKEVGGGGGAAPISNGDVVRESESARTPKTTPVAKEKSEEKKEVEMAAAVANGEVNGVKNGDDGEKFFDLLEKQSSLIQRQQDDIDDLRRRLEENARMTDTFRAELGDIRKRMEEEEKSARNSGVNGNNNNNSSNSNLANSVKEEGTLRTKIDNLTAAYNDIQDRLYEIDKSWKNNLVVYGIPAESSEEDPAVTEEKVRDVLHKKLHISREIAMNRITRLWHGPDFRGHKPIQLCIVNYRDKEEILRKARLLKGSNIYISEDFSRKVREHRHELIKFMKEVRSRDPTRRMTLRYDKLYMGHDVFFFNDRSGKVERLHGSLDTAGTATAVSGLIGSIAVNEGHGSAHDPTWLRRPRSRTGHSRGATPPPTHHYHNGHLPSLSRQNSLSMDEIHSPATQRRRFGPAASTSTHPPALSSTRRQQAPRSAAFANGGGGGGRAAASARRQRAAMMAASASVDSLDYESDGGLTTSPGGSPTKGTYGFGGGGGDGGGGRIRETDLREDDIGSTTPSPTKSRKTVAFSGVPDVERDPRLVNGHQRDGYASAGEDEDDVILTAETSGSALVPYSKHEVVPHHSNRNHNHHYQQQQHRRELQPTSHHYHNGIDHISGITAASATVLPPIGIDYATTRNFPLSPPATRPKYVIQAPNGSVSSGGYYGNNEPPPVSASDPDAASALPAILQSSLGKLEMNFVQNKSLEVPTQSLELSREGKALSGGLMAPLEGPDATTELVRKEEEELERRQQQQPQSNGGHGVKTAANGVLKVAMYGEFPITATTTAVTRTNQS